MNIQCPEPEKEPQLKYFLTYHEEDIQQFNHPDIIRLKLDQTEYFEYESYRMLKPEDIPDVKYIGFISPKVLKKSKYKTVESLFTVDTSKPFRNISISENCKPCEEFAAKNHGIDFLVLWTWLWIQLGIPLNIMNKYPMFYCNCWVADRDTFISYLEFAKKAIKMIDNAPEDIKEILKTDPKYKGALTGKGILEKRFGKPYYPWQPFLMERLVCVYAYIKEANIQLSLKDQPCLLCQPHDLHEKNIFCSEDLPTNHSCIPPEDTPIVLQL